jgi:hypothetical protein
MSPGVAGLRLSNSNGQRIMLVILRLRLSIEISKTLVTGAGRRERR